jgi:hypothetical protein
MTRLRPFTEAERQELIRAGAMEHRTRAEVETFMDSVDPRTAKRLFLSGNGSLTWRLSERHQWAGGRRRFYRSERAASCPMPMRHRTALLGLILAALAAQRRSAIAAFGKRRLQRPAQDLTTGAS